MTDAQFTTAAPAAAAAEFVPVHIGVERQPRADGSGPASIRRRQGRRPVQRAELCPQAQRVRQAFVAGKSRGPPSVSRATGFCRPTADGLPRWEGGGKIRQEKVRPAFKGVRVSPWPRGVRVAAAQRRTIIAAADPTV